MPKTTSEVLRARWEELRKLSGRECLGLPYRAAAERRVVRVVPFGDATLFENQDLEDEETTGWLPLASLTSASGEFDDDFLVVGASAPFPVGVWRHDAGFVTTWPSLDAFIGKLATGNQPTALERVRSALTPAYEHSQSGRHAEAVALLGDALVGVDEELSSIHVAGRSRAEHVVRQALGIQGLSLRALGRVDEALSVLRRASAMGYLVADLNLLDTLINHLAQPRAALDHVAKVRAQGDFWQQDRPLRAWVYRYAVLALLALNDEAGAEREVANMNEEFKRPNDRPHFASLKESLALFVERHPQHSFAAKLAAMHAALSG